MVVGHNPPKGFGVSPQPLYFRNKFDKYSLVSKGLIYPTPFLKVNDFFETRFRLFQLNAIFALNYENLQSDSRIELALEKL